jgi:ribonucleoside-triphosphate reductase
LKVRNLEDIEKDLASAREALSFVEGTPAEVYSRIVGYYRSVRNWNLGKREEYGERRLYRCNGLDAAATSPLCEAPSAARQPSERHPARQQAELHLRLFVRSSCPACPPAKDAAGRLGIPVELVNADTADGMNEALRLNVFSTPTAILLSKEGEELARAGDAETIGQFLETRAPLRFDAIAV